MVTIQDIGSLGGETSVVAISDSDQVTGWAETAEGAGRAFLWDGINVNDLGVLSGNLVCSGHAINDVNQIVGLATDAQGNDRGVLIVNGSIVDLNSKLNPLDQERYTLTEATGINASG